MFRIHEVGKSSSRMDRALLELPPPALLELHASRGVFVANRSASWAALAGVSITSAVSRLADIDQVPAAGTHLLGSAGDQQGGDP